MKSEISLLDSEISLLPSNGTLKLGATLIQGYSNSGIPRDTQILSHFWYGPKTGIPEPPNSEAILVWGILK